MNAHQRRVGRRELKRNFINVLRTTKAKVDNGSMTFLEAVWNLRQLPGEVNHDNRN